MSDRPVDLDLRVVRYVVTAADEGGFGRAAEALGLTQPSLSRQVQRLERRLGAALFVRTPTGVRTTETGEVFVRHGRSLLRDGARAVDAARADHGVVVGHAPGLDVTAAVLAARGADVTVRTRRLDWCDAGAAVASGEVDVAVAYHPIDADGLRLEALFEERRLVAVAPHHRLATRPSVRPDDLAHERLPTSPDAPPEARSFWRLESVLGHRPEAAGIEMASLDDSWQMVAQGDVVAVVTATQARSAPHDLVLVPLEGVAPARVVVASRALDPSSAVATMRRFLLDAAQVGAATGDVRRRDG